VSLEWEQTIVDAKDPAALGRWWSDALSWVVVNDAPDEYEIRPSENRLPGLLFVAVPEAKSGKNRLHLDFRHDDRDAEVTRLLDLGATLADVGQGAQSWVVLADPEGNEFCVLGSRNQTPSPMSSCGRPGRFFEGDARVEVCRRWPPMC
jgi:glyoxalase superfamily protein